MDKIYYRGIIFVESITMEANFQTSFIPKKPIIEEREKVSRPIGFFTIIAIFIFVTMVLSLAGVYFYKQIMIGQIATMEKNLTLAKDRFEPTKITELQVLDKRLRASTEILSKHIAVTPIFEVLQGITMKSIRYTTFSYEFVGTGKDAKVAIKLGGLATGYRAIALQSDLYAKNKYLIDPVFSNLSLDEKGNVLFALDFYVDPSFVGYKETLERNNPDTPLPPPAESSLPSMLDNNVPTVPKTIEQ